jgi:hypothetical protein
MRTSKIKSLFWIFCLISIQHLFAANPFDRKTTPICRACIAETLANEGPNDLLDTPFPPRDLQGTQKVNRSKKSIVNIITWKTPTCGVEPVSYEIYRDASLTNLIGTVSANRELKFKDKARKKNKKYSYFLISIDSEGRKSVPIGIVFKKGKTHITPPDLPIQTLLIRPHFSPLSIGDQVQLQAYAVLADCSLHRITNLSAWDSSDRTIVDIDQNGNATGIRPGTVSISVKVGQASAQTPLTVTTAILLAIQIRLYETFATNDILVGDKVGLQAIGIYNVGPFQDITDSVIWNSNPSSIVSLSKDPLLPIENAKGENQGTTRITASKETVTSNAITMNVFSLDQLQGITIEPRSQQISLSKHLASFIALGLFPNDAKINITRKVNWSSSNSNIASNIFLGVFILHSTGRVEINASRGNIEGTATLTISP